MPNAFFNKRRTITPHIFLRYAALARTSSMGCALSAAAVAAASISASPISLPRRCTSASCARYGIADTAPRAMAALRAFVSSHPKRDRHTYNGYRHRTPELEFVVSATIFSLQWLNDDGRHEFFWSHSGLSIIQEKLGKRQGAFTIHRNQFNDAILRQQRWRQIRGGEASIRLPATLARFLTRDLRIQERSHTKAGRRRVSIQRPANP